MIRYGNQEILSQALRVRACVRANYNYTPLARSVFASEANGLNNRAVAQLINSYTFGQLSTLSPLVSASSGATATVPALDWYDRPNVSAILSFALGLTPF